MLNSEKETYINFNDAEAEAVLCTYNAGWLRKMDVLCERHEGFSVRKREEGYGEYVFPKKYVQVRGPRELSEKQKAVLESMQEQKRTKNAFETSGTD